MKIYTKTGDKGSTSLVSGKRILKSDLRIEAYGTVDELNSWLGIIRSSDAVGIDSPRLIQAQNMLFCIGSHLANDDPEPKFPLPKLSETEVSDLEQAMDQMDAELPPMRNFVLPGGLKILGEIHVARCVCRRAERRCIALHQEHPLNEVIVQFLNRLSDYLFVLSRFVAMKNQVEETPWKPAKT